MTIDLDLDFDQVFLFLSWNIFLLKHENYWKLGLTVLAIAV